MSERYELLLARLLDQALDTAGREELAALLLADPALQRDYVQRIQQHVALRSQFGGSLSESARVDLDAARSLRESPTGRLGRGSGAIARRRPPARRSRRARGTPWAPVVWALAAVLLLAVGLFWAGRSRPQSAPAPAPVAAAPSAPQAQPIPAAPRMPAVVLAGGELPGLATGAALEPGRAYHAQQAGARLRCDDGSLLDLAPGTELALEAAAGPTRLFLLRQGQVEVTAAPQAPGRRLALRTPELRAEVVGTRFAVAHGADGSLVAVDEGRVRVQLGDGDWQELQAGESLRSRPAAAAVPAPARVIDASDPRWQVHGDLPWSGAGPSMRFGLPEAHPDRWRGRALLWSQPLAVADGFELSVTLRIPDELAGRWHVELAAVAEPALDAEAQARQMLRLNVDEEAIELLQLRAWYFTHDVVHRQQRPLEAGLHRLSFSLRGQQVTARIDDQLVFAGEVAHGYQQVQPALRVSRKGETLAGELELTQFELRLPAGGD